MKSQEYHVREEMRNVIARSCVLSHPQEHHLLYNFQKELLRFFFRSVDVTVNYKASTITLWNSENPKKTGEDNLYSLNNIVSVTISYTNLEETLRGCLEEGNEAINFYRRLLLQYGNPSHLDMLTAVSA